MAKKGCSLCGGASHSSMQCFLRPKKAMQTRAPLKAKKRMKKIGRIGQALLDQRMQYFEEHDPPYFCIYCLFIGIDIPILEDHAQIEHGHTKNDYPGLRFSKGNLHISCGFHNKDKGDKDIDEYLEILKRQKEPYDQERRID